MSTTDRPHVLLYDTTLRDGTQGEEVAFSTEDKVRIAHLLDDIGFHYVEGGYPGSNPRDRGFFELMRAKPLKQAKLVAFGMTMRAGADSPADDPMLRTLIEAETPAVCIVGKSWDLHVTEALRTSLEANLDAVERSVAHCRAARREVLFDAEHFFDGMRHNPDYALAVVGAAVRGGADWVVLCDTNGGALPEQVTADVERIRSMFPSVRVGIHTHNDSGLAVANSLAAVQAGAEQVQGTVGGLGERCGNANIVTCAATLALKTGRAALPPAGLQRLTELTRVVMELANLAFPRHLPYVGTSAFAHKGGMHVSGIRRNPMTYEHIEPERVGNDRRILVSDLAGRATLLEKLDTWGIRATADDARLEPLLARLKELEHAGYQYEGAEASFELVVRRAFGATPRGFQLLGYRVVDERGGEDAAPVTEATVRLEVGGQVEHTVATGNGPVNALDSALRKALTRFYPELRDMQLLDYKVRVLSAQAGTDATVRVLVESGSAGERWGTVGVGTNVIDASWEALRDALDYRLLKVQAARAAKPDVA
jgi:2-isopropylmalate synthase